MNKEEKHKINLDNIISKVKRRNDGESIVSFVKKNNMETKKKKGRPKKNAIIPEGEKECRYTFIVNESKLNRLQNISHDERLQMKNIFDCLIDAFLSEYDNQTKEE